MKTTWKHLALLACVLCLLLFPSVGYGLEGEQVLTHLQLAEDASFTHGIESGQQFRPFYLVTVWMNSLFTESSPESQSFWVLPYLSTNLFLHIITALLLYCLSYALINKREIALTSALLFGLYPGVMNVIPFVTRRADILSTLFVTFSLLLLYYFHRTGQKHYLAGSVLAGGAALGSKGISITLVPLAVILTLLYDNRSLWHKIGISSIFAVLGGIYLIVRQMTLTVPTALFTIFRFNTESIIASAYTYKNLVSYLLFPLNTPILQGLRETSLGITIGSTPVTLEHLIITAFSGMLLAAATHVFSKIAKNSGTRTITISILWISCYLLIYLTLQRAYTWYVYAMVAPLSLLGGLLWQYDSGKRVLILLLACFVLTTPLFMKYSTYSSDAAHNTEIIRDLTPILSNMTDGETLHLINWPQYKQDRIHPRSPNSASTLSPHGLQDYIQLRYDKQIFIKYISFVGPSSPHKQYAAGATHNTSHILLRTWNGTVETMVETETMPEQPSSLWETYTLHLENQTQRLHIGPGSLIGVLNISTTDVNITTIETPDSPNLISQDPLLTSFSINTWGRYAINTSIIDKLNTSNSFRTYQPLNTRISYSNNVWYADGWWDYKTKPVSGVHLQPWKNKTTYEPSSLRQSISLPETKNDTRLYAYLVGYPRVNKPCPGTITLKTVNTDTGKTKTQTQQIQSNTTVLKSDITIYAGDNVSLQGIIEPASGSCKGGTFDTMVIRLLFIWRQP